MSVFLKIRVKPEYILLIVLLFIALLFNYHHILFLRPVGIHQWRSCVSAAFPVNLANGGSFFTTQTNALLADGFTSDITVVEFPLIYFIISIFYRVFGVHEFWFRGFQVAIGFMGLIYLFKLSYFFTRDWVYASFIPLVIFTSPVYAFYLIGFIPDAVALSLTFGGIWYFCKYSKSKRFRTWLLSMLFLLLAGLTKTSSLLPWFGLAGVALLDLMDIIRKRESESMFVFKWETILAFIGVFIMVFAWYLYARLYSQVHSGSVSAVEIRPIWELDREGVQNTLDAMQRWFKRGSYHARWFLILTGLVFVFNLFFSSKANNFLYRFSILVFLGALAFTLLFFRSMRNHDYYQINNIFILAPIYLTFFSILSLRFPLIYKSILTKLTFLIIVVFLVINCNKVMQFRYSEQDAHYVSSLKNIEMYDIESYLDEIGVNRSKTVHCTPDRSINISLYLTNRKGLTEYSPLRNLSLEERVPKLRELGIDYLILGSREEYKDEDVDAILGERIGKKGGTEIFWIGPEVKKD